ALVQRIVEVKREPSRKRCSHLAIHRELRHRQDRDGAGRLFRPLRLDIEPTQGVDRVAEQLDANRFRRRRREESENAAPKPEFAGFADEIGPNESILDERLQKGVEIEIVSFSDADEAPKKFVGYGKSL